MRVQIRKKSTISQSDAQSNLRLSVGETKEMIVGFMFWERRRQRRTPLSVSGGAGEMLRGLRSPHINTPEEKRKKLHHLRELLSSCLVHHGPGQEALQVGDHWRTPDEHQWQRGIEASKHQKTKQRQNPPQSVYPAAIWPEIQEYPLQHHQTTSFLQLNSSSTVFLCKIKKDNFRCTTHEYTWTLNIQHQQLL